MQITAGLGAVTVVATFSRGGFIGLVVLGFMLLQGSKRKMQTGMIAGGRRPSLRRGRRPAVFQPRRHDHRGQRRRLLRHPPALLEDQFPDRARSSAARRRAQRLGRLGQLVELRRAGEPPLLPDAADLAILRRAQHLLRGPRRYRLHRPRSVPLDPGDRVHQDAADQARRARRPGAGLGGRSGPRLADQLRRLLRLRRGAQLRLQRAGVRHARPRLAHPSDGQGDDGRGARPRPRSQPPGGSCRPIAGRPDAGFRRAEPACSPRSRPSSAPAGCCWAPMPTPYCQDWRAALSRPHPGRGPPGQHRGARRRGPALRASAGSRWCRRAATPAWSAAPCRREDGSQLVISLPA